jgi:hypothetical protein
VLARLVPARSCTYRWSSVPGRWLRWGGKGWPRCWCRLGWAEKGTLARHRLTDLRLTSLRLTAVAAKHLRLLLLLLLLLPQVLEAGVLEEADAWLVLRGILAGLAHIHSQVGVLVGGSPCGCENVCLGCTQQEQP